MTTTNVQISTNIGFGASSWRSGDPPQFEDQNITLIYNEKAFNPLTQQSDTPTNIDLTNIYGKVFWDTFFSTLFPSVKNQDFISEKSSSVPGSYYTQLYKIAATDFFDSYFKGRDDLGSNSQGQSLSLNNWSTLTPEAQQLIIKKYLYTRSTFIDSAKEFTSKMFLNNLNLRSLNVFYYVAELMVGVMSQLQQNTINAGQYATRLAENQQAISKEMQKSIYLYKTLLNASDYGTTNTNENNGQKLENLRMRRDMVQKETDQASTFLETSQQTVEENSNQALQFMQKGSDLSKIFFKNF
jgi:hypothetical protein